MSEEMMNTREVARYLDIHEKQVYALIREEKIPSTKITGKWLFPRKLIDEWIESNAEKGYKRARQKSGQIAGALLASGSNDPVLDILQTYVRKTYPEFNIFSANTGSTEGLRALNLGYTDVAWSHLLDPETGEYNIPFLAAYLPRINPVVVNLFHRDLGFITSAGNLLQIKGFDDLTNEGALFINRQSGSGTRVLLDYNLKKLGISPDMVKGYETEVYTHFEVGLAILSGDANVGIATGAISKLLGLPFTPIIRESFDMIIDQSTFFDKGVQTLIELLNSNVFRKRVEKIGSYEFGDSGKILYSRQ